MKKILMFCIPALFLLNGCNNDVPDPQVKEEGQAAMNLGSETALASAYVQSQDITVHYLIKGNNVYIDCKAPSLSFREDSGKETGKIILEMDGKTVGEYKSAAFVVRNVESGQHQALLKIINNKGINLFQKEFTVTIN
ncbi:MULTISPECIES: hypothetical protein [Bacillaceae]|uniref:hypothetical protein n=1 Tax=Bacillaceae TaxID=186817 RepID=UPI001E385FD6|nr:MULTISPECIES: hypothetical protein [Bacillaceae]MCE4048429.1 hypothetical protein [Bacillus sp. Au-Bac7]MCM3029102.1 hypothetical protein [Niallia sp. MER 6]